MKKLLKDLLLKIFSFGKLISRKEKELETALQSGVQKIKVLCSKILSFGKLIYRLESALQSVQQVTEKVTKLDEEIAEIKENISRVEERLTPQAVKKIQDPNLLEIEKYFNIRLQKKPNFDKDECLFALSMPCWTEGPSCIESLFPFNEIDTYSYENRGEGARKYSFKYGEERFTQLQDGQLILDLLKKFKKIPITKIVSETPYMFTVKKSPAATWDDELIREVCGIFAHMFLDENKKNKIGTEKIESDDLVSISTFKKQESKIEG